MVCKNYDDWKRSVRKTYDELAAVSYYLSDDGKERLMVFDLLDTLSLSFADTAEELIRMLEAKEDEDICEAMESPHIQLPLKALKRISGNT